MSDQAKPLIGPGDYFIGAECPICKNIFVIEKLDKGILDVRIEAAGDPEKVRYKGRCGKCNVESTIPLPFVNKYLINEKGKAAYLAKAGEVVPPEKR